MTTEKPLKRARAEEVTGMVLGRDAAQLGGLQVQSNWLANSDTSACGKLAVLERLLDLWRKDATNKVRAFLQSHMC